MKSLLSIAVFVYLLIALLNTSLFQTMIANIASEFFSKQWKTEVRISALSIDIFRGVKVYDVYLEDQKGDTIIAANSIRVSFDFFPFHNGLNINNVNVNDITFNLAKEDGKLNFSFIIDYFKSNKEKKKKDKKPFVVRVRHLSMHNVNFLLDVTDADDDLKDGLVNPRYEKYTNVNAEISNIKVIKDSILCDIEHFEAKERSGFVLSNLQGKVIASPSLISIQDLSLITPYSKIYADCKLQATDWKTYKYYMDSVDMDVVLKERTLLGGQDATYWAAAMEGFTESFFVSGKVKGTTANMNIKDLDIRTKNTHIAVEGLIRGLPNIENTYFDLSVSDLSSSYQDVSNFSLGKIGEKIKLPELLANIGQFSCNTNVTGTFKDFDAMAVLTSEVGSLDLVARGQYDEITKQTNYAAELNTLAFNLGQALGNDIVGTTDLNAKVTLIGTDFKNNMTANILADLHYATIKGNVYNSINFDGNLHNGKIDAKLNIDDKDIVLIADALVDLTNSKQTSLNITADIKNANVAKVNFFQFSDTNAIVSAKITADVKSMDMKNLNATADISNFEVKNTKKDFTINNLHLSIVPVDSLIKRLTIVSEVLDFNLNGRFELNEIGQDFANVINNYLPDLNDQNEKASNSKDTLQPSVIKSNITFNAKLKNITPLLNLFVPQIELNDIAGITGLLNDEDKLQLNFTSHKLKYSTIRLDNLSVDCKDNKGALDINIMANRCFLTDSLYMPAINGNIKANKQKLDMALLFVDKANDPNQLQGQLNMGIFIDGKNMHGGFSDSYLQVLNRKIDINNNNLISYNGETLSLLNFLLSEDKEKILVEGDISKSFSDVLKVKFDNVDISLLNPFLKEAQTTLGGKLNESVSVKALLDKPVFSSSLRIDDLTVNDIALGYAWLNVSNTYNSDKLYADIKLLKQDSIQNMPLSLKGYITPVQKNDNKDSSDFILDLSLGFKDFNIGFIKNYLASFSSQFNGHLFADNIKIAGSLKEPKITGNLFVKDGSMKIDMLNTTYFFNDTIRLSNNTFAFKNFLFYDEQQSRVVLNGAINHTAFKDYDIHLNALADKIKILNTKASASTKYYGTAYASATAKLDGNLNQMNIDIQAKTERGTILTVPVSSKTSAKENSFITIVSNTSNDTIAKSSIDDKAIKMNIAMDLHVTPDAQINVPMDFKEITGSLSASPSGDLKIDLDGNGQIRMYGKVDIDNGNFNMGLLSAVERNFVLQKGGSIQFVGGSPSEAQVDIKAIYKTKASLAMLGKEYETRKADVDCIVKLTGSLTDPQPAFDVQLPNTDQQTTDQLFNTLNIDKNNGESMFMQVAYLMISGGFYSDVGNYANNFSESYLENSAFDALLSQVNNKISDILDLSFTSGIEMNKDDLSGNRFNAGVSKSFGKWSINLSSSFNTNNQQAEESNISTLGTFEGSVEYHISDNFLFHGYNKSNKDDFEKATMSPYTQGVGLQYRKQYRKFSDIFKRKNKNKPQSRTDTINDKQ
ncbi:MAG: translocation/assembly module TamB [Bacteroidales bacterium]|nr:translocation/assembly module TamB [Bacteroidales bacterium]